MCSVTVSQLHAHHLGANDHTPPLMPRPADALAACPSSPSLQSSSAAQVTDSMKSQRRNVFSMLALQTNIEALEAYLKKEELREHVACLR